MDESEYKTTVERLQAVDGVIKDLDPAVRAEAFAILKPYVTGTAADESDEDEEDGDGGDESTPRPRKRTRKQTLDLDQMVEDYASDRPHENALLALAILYSRRGRQPFQLKEIKAIAEDELNLDVPENMSMTFSGLKRKDALLLRHNKSEGWKVTPSGGRWLEETYKVTKGRASPSA
jgi:hypothetical protein